jgi:hypothetical protein
MVVLDVPLLCFVLLVPIACVTTSSGEEQDGDAEAVADAPDACDDFTAEIREPQRTGPQYRELLNATSAGDPQRAEIRRRVGLAEIAVGRASAGCEQLTRAQQESPAPQDAIDSCCDVSDASSEFVAAEQTRQPGTCDDQACAEGGNGKCCQKLSIKYEYEMLDARARGDKKAEREYAERLETTRRLACEGGIEVSCESSRAQ